MLKISNVSREFIDGEEKVLALNSLSYTFPDKGLFAVVGPSGSGKSTLINILCGLDKPTEGEVFFDDIDLLQQTEEWWDDFRNVKMGIVFQDYQLFEEKTVLENTEFPLSIQSIDSEKANDQAREMLSYVGLSEAHNKKTIKLSGGQKQRVAIARTVVKNPDIILADEPTGNLDEENSRRVFGLLRNAAKNRLVLVVSHDKDLCREYADVILTLRSGKIVAEERMERSEGQKEGPESGDVVGFLSEGSRVPKAMDAKLRCRVVFEGIKLRKTRMIIAVAMMVLIATIIYCLCLVAYSDDAKSVAKYLERSETHMIPVQLLIPEDKQIFAEKDSVSWGERTKEYLEKHSDSAVLLPSGYETVMTFRVKEWAKNIPEDKRNKEHYEVAHMHDATRFLLNPKDFAHLTVQGRAPEKADELVMSKALADKCGISVSDLPYYCDCSGKEYWVVGIASKAFSTELKETPQSNVTEKRQNEGIVNSVWVIADEREKPDTLGVLAFDMISARGIYDYVYNSASIIPVSKIETPLAAGRMPEHDNEMLLSEYYLEIHNLRIEDVVGKNYNLKDVYSEKYGIAFWDCFNLYDYVGKSIQIVGVSQMDADYGVTDSLYETLADWTQKFSVGYVYGKDEVETKDVRELWKNNIRLDLESLNGFYTYCGQRDAVRKYLLVAAGVLACILILMMVYVFSYRISDDRKRIALLRSIGVRKADISKMYYSEAIITAGVVSVLSVVLSLIMCGIINNMFTEIFMNKVNIRAVAVRPGIVIVISLAIIALVMLTVSIPLRRLQKKKPMEVFKTV